MLYKTRLMTPGPSPVPEDVLLELARPVFHHRTDAFRELLAKVVDGLREVFKTRHDVLVFASSGTGAMEAAVVNLLPPGGKAIVVEGGKFGERWGELCTTYGIEPVAVRCEWGDWVRPEQIATALQQHPDAAAVLATLCETSTGVAHDIEGIGRAVAESDAVLVVDGISGVGAMELWADRWGVDCLAVGSQKALMMPPGLAMLAVSPKAWRKIEAVEPRGYYFDLRKARKSMADFDTPFTPAHTMVLAQLKALERLLASGIEAVWEHHRILSDATLTGVRAAGLEPFAKRPATGLTAVRVPDGVDGKALVAHLREKHQLTVAGGQGQLKGKIIRVAHMGYMDAYDCLTALAAIEFALAELGHDVELGRAVAAAQRALAPHMGKG